VNSAILAGMVITLVAVNGETYVKSGDLAPVRSWVATLIVFALLGLLSGPAPQVAGPLALLIPLGYLLNHPKLLGDLTNLL
jgi:ABC-type thiamin/hydroxymethylpyrimidine transport system permease subunit